MTRDSTYVLIYDAARATGPKFGLIVLGAVLLMIGVLMVRGARRNWIPIRPFRGDWRITRGWGIAILLFSSVPVCIALIELDGGRRLRAALRRGSYELVEGTIQDFTPGDEGGHRMERWSVVSGGRTYRYEYVWSQYEPGFRQSAGPIREGLHVRIADVQGQIARLEIRNEPADDSTAGQPVAAPDAR